jgi:hypothetical protein
MNRAEYSKHLENVYPGSVGQPVSIYKSMADYLKKEPNQYKAVFKLPLTRFTEMMVHNEKYNLVLVSQQCGCKEVIVVLSKNYIRVLQCMALGHDDVVEKEILFGVDDISDIQTTKE